MTVILSCFVGRKRYLEILSVYIDILLAKKLVDEIHIWDYTREESDAAWIRERWPLEYIFEVRDKSTYREYYQYYSKERYPEDDTVLVKCDDDIVYIDTDAFGEFIIQRKADTHPLLATACVINNPICSIFLYKTSNFNFGDSKDVHFFTPDHATFMHESFLEGKIEKSASPRFHKLFFKDFKVNINFIAVLSRDFDILSKHIGKVNDEDEFHNVAMFLKRPVMIDGHFFVAHMAYNKQRDDGFDETEILEKYSHLRNKTFLEYKERDE